MPGISAVFAQDDDLAQQRPRILKSLASLLHYHTYHQTVLLEGNTVFLAATRHEAYPVTTSESDELFICIEGSIYGKPEAVINRELERLANSIFTNGGGYKNETVRWLLETDGDFLVFMLHKPTGEICIANNALGRLPLYYHSSDRTLIVSREPSFIIGLLGDIQFDRDAISHYLLFGYALGNKTIFRNIFQLEPASVIRAGGSTGIRIENLHRHNYENAERKSVGGTGIKQHARALVDLLEAACRNRCDSTDRSIMALSGGLDSRMVASCLTAINCEFQSITFRDTHYIPQNEVRIAERVAKALRSDWKLFNVGLARGGDVLELLGIGSGLNFLGMSFSLPLCRMIRDALGCRIRLFTGDGGEKVLRDIRPVGRIRNIDSLANYVLDHNQLMGLDTVCALTGRAAPEILESLRHHLVSYDERRMKSKYVHFIMYERCVKWNYSGEDRNRSFCWPVAPFFAIDVWSHAMDCPFDSKNRFKLYREMLMLLSPEVARIENSAWKLPLTSKKMQFYFLARELALRLPPAARRFINTHRGYREALAGYAEERDLVKCLLEQLENCSAIAEYLSVDAIRSHLHRIDKLGFDHLFTLTSTIEHFTGTKSAIEKYRECELI